MSQSHLYATVLAEERRGGIRHAALTATVLAVCVAALWITDFFDSRRFIEGIPALAQLASEMVPPDFGRWQHWLKPLLDTLAMSIAGTVLAVVISLPLAVLAAPNTSPNGLLCQVTRALLAFLRSVPEIILGVIFVAAVGFGALPGVLALALHSVGMVGKFFAESIEHAHPAPIEAAQAAGARTLQVIAHGVIPQVFTQFADVVMYRWEYNFRASTVMGMVGAGGIGTELVGSLRLLDYPQVLAILIVILAAVSIVDGLSGYLRRKFQ